MYAGIGEWRDKAWGRTRTLVVGHNAEVVECEIKAGGFSSVHFHEFKSNEFVIMEGKIDVPNLSHEEPIEIILSAGDSLRIAPGVKHQFRAITDCRLIEIYTRRDGGKIDPADIVRLSEGGIAE
jgi:quercetin dioxygenase-like cupin family protein